MKIYSLGSLNIDYVYTVDHFVSAGETLSSKSMNIFPGGKGLNQSIATSKAGANVIHGAVVGDGGELLLDALSSAGVDSSRIKNIGGNCGHTIIQVDKTGQNCILLFPGTNQRMDKEYAEQFLHDAEPGDILILQNEINALDIIFAIAHSKQMQIVFNPSPLQLDMGNLPLDYVNWWFCNEIEGEALFGSSDPQKIAENFIKKYPHSHLILTLGGNGSVFKDADRYLIQPAYKATAVDTTAAGDTFTGYFMAMIAAGKDVAFALDTASKAAAIAVSRPGAASSIPTMEEVTAAAL